MNARTRFTLSLALALTSCAAGSPAPSSTTAAPSPSALSSAEVPSPSGLATPAIDPTALQGRILFGRAGGDFGDATIFTANADGTSDERIGGFLADKTTCCPRWSPDGSHVAIVALAPDERFTTAIIEPDGSNLQLFELPDAFQGACTVWLGTTGRMACEAGYMDDPTSGGIYAVDAADGSDPQPIVTDVGMAIVLDASPDGSQIVFVGDAVGPPTGVEAPVGSLYVVNVDGSDLHRITPDGVYALGNARWSPDGAWILFGGLGRTGDPLWAVRPDGSGFRVVYQPENSWAAVSPTWSPDGQLILFALNPPDSLSTLSVAPPNRLCVIRADGTDLTCVIETDDWKIWPDWAAAP